MSQALRVPVPRADPPANHAQALQRWQGAEDIAAWAGRHFRFEAERALQFSSTQRRVGPPPTVAEPAELFERPAGICQASQPDQPGHALPNPVTRIPKAPGR